MFQKIKIDYVITIIFIMTAALGILGRRTVVNRIDTNYRLHLDQLEEHSRVLYLSQHLRNLSHNINVHGTIYFISGDPAEKANMHLNRKSYAETLGQLKTSPLFKSSKDQKLLNNLNKLISEKVNFLLSSNKENLKTKTGILLSPKLQSKNIELRTSLETLIKKQAEELRQERGSLTESHNQVLQGNMVISILLFLLSLLLAIFVLRNARRLRIAHQKTLEAVKSRDDILAVVSHDLKNPLSSISLNAQILKKRLSDPEKPEGPIFKKVESILKSVEIMKNLIQDLLDQAKLEFGKLELEIQEVNLNEVLNEVEDVMVPLLQNQSIHIENHLPQTPAIIKADKKRLMQILSNLLSNAIKFSKNGGKVEVIATEAGSDLKISVQDHGVGIPAKDLPHVFDRFWQAEETAKKGTGLGLSIVRNLVNAHGGKIWVESKPGAGTVFIFTLPLA